MPRRIIVPSDVAALIGADRAATIIAGPHPAEFRCTVCGVVGLVSSGARLVVGLDVYTNDTMRVWFAHQHCAPGGVRRIHRDYVADQTTQTVGVCIILNSPLFGPQPSVIVEHLLTHIRVDPGGETTHTDLDAYTTLGCQPVRGIGVPPPPYVPGWRVVLPGTAGGGIFAPHGVTVLDPMCPVPDPWPAAVTARGGTCAVYIAAALGIREICLADPDTFMKAIDAKATAGLLLGVTARVTV